MYIAMNRFRVNQGDAETVLSEQNLANRRSTTHQYDKVPGFVEFHLLREGP